LPGFGLSNSLASKFASKTGAIRHWGLAANAQVNAENAENLSRWATEVTDYISKLGEHPEKTVGDTVNNIYNTINGDKVKANRLKPFQPLSIDQITFSNITYKDATPSEKDKYRKLNETNLSLAKKMTKAMQDIAKNTKIQKDQDTEIKKKLTATLQESKKQSKTLNKNKSTSKSDYNPFTGDSTPTTGSNIPAKLLKGYYWIQDKLFKLWFAKTIGMVAVKGIWNLGKFAGTSAWKILTTSLKAGKMFLFAPVEAAIGLNKLGKFAWKNLTKFFTAFKNIKFVKTLGYLFNKDPITRTLGLETLKSSLKKLFYSKPKDLLKAFGTFMTTDVKTLFPFLAKHKFLYRAGTAGIIIGGVYLVAKALGVKDQDWLNAAVVIKDWFSETGLFKSTIQWWNEQDFKTTWNIIKDFSDTALRSYKKDGWKGFLSTVGKGLFESWVYTWKGIGNFIKEVIWEENLEPWLMNLFNKDFGFEIFGKKFGWNLTEIIWEDTYKDYKKALKSQNKTFDEDRINNIKKISNYNKYDSTFLYMKKTGKIIPGAKKMLKVYYSDIKSLINNLDAKDRKIFKYQLSTIDGLINKGKILEAYDSLQLLKNVAQLTYNNQKNNTLSINKFASDKARSEHSIEREKKQKERKNNYEYVKGITEGLDYFNDYIEAGGKLSNSQIQSLIWLQKEYKFKTGKDYMIPHGYGKNVKKTYQDAKNKVKKQTKEGVDFVTGVYKTYTPKDIQKNIEKGIDITKNAAKSYWDFGMPDEIKNMSFKNALENIFTKGNEENTGNNGYISNFNGGNGRAKQEVYKGKRAIRYPNGYLKVAGNRNWRNNNPGNIHASPKSVKKYKACGYDWQPNNTADKSTLIFCTMDQGFNALGLLLKTVYANHNILSFGGKYQTKHTSYEYGAKVQNYAKVPLKSFKYLSKSELVRVAKGIYKVEGSKEGFIVKSGKEYRGSQMNNIISKMKEPMPKSFNDFGEWGKVLDSIINTGGESVKASGAVGLANQLVGKVKYVWGGKEGNREGAIGLDCSGFIQMLMSKAYKGLNFPGSTITQQKWFENAVQLGAAQKINQSSIQAGDIIFFGNSSRVTHVAIASGKDEMIHSSGGEGCTPSNPCKGVSKSKISSYYKKPQYIYRLVDPGKANAIALNDISYTTPSNSISPVGSGGLDVPGIGTFKTGGEFLSKIGKKIQEIQAQVFGLKQGVGELAKDSEDITRNSLSGTINVSECQQ